MPLDGVMKIAGTIMVDGHEYVIVTIEAKASVTGRSVMIVAIDKDTAEQEQKRSIERTTAMDAQTSVVRTIAKMIEDAADKGGSGFNLGGY